MRGHSLPGRERPLTSSSLRHLQSLRVHPIPQDGRVSGGRYLKVVGRTSAALTNARESRSAGANSLEECRLRRFPDRVDGLGRRRDHDDPVDDLAHLESTAERTYFRKGLHAIVVEDRDFGLCNPGFAQEEFGERDIDDDLTRLHTRSSCDAVLHAPALVRIFERCEHGPRRVREVVPVRREDALVELAILQAQRDLALERPLAHEPVQELVVHHLLDVRDWRIRTLHRAREHLLAIRTVLWKYTDEYMRPRATSIPSRAGRPFRSRASSPRWVRSVCRRREKSIVPCVAPV